MLTNFKQNYNRFLGVLLLVFLAQIAFQPGFTLFAADLKSEDSLRGHDGILAKKTDDLCKKLAGVFEGRLLKLAALLNAGKIVRIEIRNHFYDPQYRRSFVEFRGSAAFGARLPFKVKKDDYYFTSDGNLAYDLSIEKLSVRGGTITFNFQGDLVIFFDKILYEIAKTVPNVVGAVAFSAAGDLLVEFLAKINLEMLGEAISSTFSKFSAEYLSTIGAEVLHNTTAVRQESVSTMVRDAIKSGGAGNFFVLTIMKSVGHGAAHFVGASLGGIVGNLLAPGPGAIIGAYLGSKIASTIAKTVVYYLAVDLPISVFLKKIVRYEEQRRNFPNDSVARAKIEEYGRKIFQRVKREIENGVYKTFDALLGKMDGFEKTERQAFVPLLKDIREFFRFKVIEKNDWFAAKKMNQMQLQLQTWGLMNQFPF